MKKEQATFVVGRNNRKMYRAVQELFDENERNPCWIQAPSGCGKSHLVSIAEARGKEMGLRVKVVSCESFICRMIGVLRKKMDEKEEVGRQIYRYFEEPELLIVEDIDLSLKARESTQQYFASMIRELIKRYGTRILLTSGGEEEGLYSELIRQCPGALRVETACPDFFLRRSIAKEKMKEEGIKRTEAVIWEIARHTKNGAEINGVVKQMKLICGLSGKKKSMRVLVREALEQKGYL